MGQYRIWLQVSIIFSKKYRSMGQEIERSDTLFRDTITSLSHDLRTPLATANGYIQLLQEQNLTGEQKEYVTIAGERISTVKLLLDQLFEFARIEADELKLNCRNTDIHSVLRDVVASYYGDFEQKKCVPNIVIPNSPAIIWGDPDALARIFSNVVYNALVHGEGNYQITAALEEAQTVITVKNASSRGKFEAPRTIFRSEKTKHRSGAQTSELAGCPKKAVLSTFFGDAPTTGNCSRLFRRCSIFTAGRTYQRS